MVIFFLCYVKKKLALHIVILYIRYKETNKGETMENLTKRMNLRHQIYFSLSRKQQKMFNNKFSIVLMEEMRLEDLQKITKSKKIKNLYIQLMSTYSLQLVA